MNNKQLLIHGGVLVAGAGIGFGAGYLVFKKKFQRIAEQEIESVREAYSKTNTPKPDLKTLRQQVVVPEAVKEEHAALLAESEYASDAEETDAEAFRRTHGRVPSNYELIKMGQGVLPEEVFSPRDINDDDVPVTEGNIFDNPQPDPDEIGEGEDELPPRSPDRPYVIEVSEWYLNETNYDQVTLTYWADDDVLADDATRVINDIGDVVGATNLHRFGFRNENPDIVYVRNERLKVDYEITKDDRNYAEIVHGIDPDADNDSGTPRRMRSDDDR